METMRLTAEDCAATFDPADGGRLTSFVVGDHELLVAQGKDVFHFGSFVMAPWVGSATRVWIIAGPSTALPPTRARTPCTDWSRSGHGK
jgi:hypothetical protein